MKLTCENLKKVAIQCFFEDGETAQKSGIEVKGVVTTFIFNPIGLKIVKNEINALLDQLPELFHESIGGGWSFLNACMNRDSEQWGEQRDVELLMCLGIAIGRVAYCLPREMWEILPGEMPYFVIKDVKDEECKAKLEEEVKDG